MVKKIEMRIKIMRLKMGGLKLRFCQNREIKIAYNS